jgi:hypothetical protein
MTLTLFDPAFLAVAGAVAAGGYDTDAQAYITAVEAADGQALETAVKDAINAFVVGCKADGIWDSIKASCILAGARTLSGALIPLKGTAPTNYNFVSGDYNRETGLVGDGSTKYLDSNYRDSASLQTNIHASVWVSSDFSQATFALSQTGNSSTTVGPYRGSSTGGNRWVSYSRNSNINTGQPSFSSPGLVASTRSNDTNYVQRVFGTTVTTAAPAAANSTNSWFVFRANGTTSSWGNGRLSFYSIGEALDLALLDARVTTLINAIGAAIP